jgi:hypothetical protein
LVPKLHLFSYHACNIISYRSKNISSKAFCFCVCLHFLLPKWFPLPSHFFLLV